MSDPTILLKSQVEKIGNTIVYLSENVSELTKTKLLKLLFLIEEKSINDYGSPFFGIDFKIWQFGPVAPPLYSGLTNIDNSFLTRYIFKNEFDEYVKVSEFNDDEFSDNDIVVLEWAIKFARNKVAQDLVNHTHSNESLWRKGAIKHDVYQKFLTREITYTNYSIDFTLLFEDEGKRFLKDKYYSALENLHFSIKNNPTIRV